MKIGENYKAVKNSIKMQYFTDRREGVLTSVVPYNIEVLCMNAHNEKRETTQHGASAELNIYWVSLLIFRLSRVRTPMLAYIQGTSTTEYNYQEI